jgi:hypothetical protein
MFIPNQGEHPLGVESTASSLACQVEGENGEIIRRQQECKASCRNEIKLKKKKGNKNEEAQA